MLKKRKEYRKTSKQDATRMNLDSLSSSTSSVDDSPSDSNPTVSVSPIFSSSLPSSATEAKITGRTSPSQVPPQSIPPETLPKSSSAGSPSAMNRDPDALFSGGGISFLTGKEKVEFSYGYATFKGKRSSMEDYFDAKVSDVNGHMVAFFGVYDGHGGSRAAEYLKNNLFNNLCSHPDFLKDTKSAIVQSFPQTDAQYLEEEKGQQKDAGSTASTALLFDDQLIVANVGDSRIVACVEGSAVPLSNDHKPDRSDERKRIENAGGFVIWAGTWRVGGVLAVSRAFGDKQLKQYVVADPEIQEQEIDGIEFIIVASDGLWNVISNKDAVSMVQDIEDAEAASRKLTEEAYLRGSSDNITCIVVRFQKYSHQA